VLHHAGAMSIVPLGTTPHGLGAVISLAIDNAKTNPKAWMVWYTVPGRGAGNLKRYLRDTIDASQRGSGCGTSRSALLWADPSAITAWNSRRDVTVTDDRVPLFRHVQAPGEFMAFEPGAVRWGVSLGVCWTATAPYVGGEGGGETASHTTPFAWCTPFLEDFSRRHSSPAFPFQRLTGKTFD
jgi:hypothetical protein